MRKVLLLIKLPKAERMDHRTAFKRCNEIPLPTYSINHAAYGLSLTFRLQNTLRLKLFWSRSSGATDVHLQNLETQTLIFVGLKKISPQSPKERPQGWRPAARNGAIPHFAPWHVGARGVVDRYSIPFHFSFSSCEFEAPRAEDGYNLGVVDMATCSRLPLSTAMYTKSTHS